ncbi:MAG: helix-turn-helix domain-containing protein [Armatimonadetes bacterium]|nr:helix-turn-helix domain-containing protein [Armatimonadota bacterium]
MGARHVCWHQPEHLLTTQDVGALLRVSPATVRRLLESGAACGIRIGRTWRDLGSDLLRLPRAARAHEAQMTRRLMRLSERAFADAWENDEDAVYDAQ